MKMRTMKTWKRILSGVLAVMLMSTAGCGSSDGIPENEFFVLKRRIKNACEKKYRKRRNHKGTRII